MESKFKPRELCGRYFRGERHASILLSAPCSQLAPSSGSFGMTVASGKGTCWSDSSRWNIFIVPVGGGIKAILHSELLPVCQSFLIHAASGVLYITINMRCSLVKSYIFGERDANMKWRDIFFCLTFRSHRTDDSELEGFLVSLTFTFYLLKKQDLIGTGWRFDKHVYFLTFTWSQTWCYNFFWSFCYAKLNGCLRLKIIKIKPQRRTFTLFWFWCPLWSKYNLTTVYFFSLLWLRPKPSQKLHEK